jgi:hypothetical protein
MKVLFNDYTGFEISAVPHFEPAVVALCTSNRQPGDYAGERDQICRKHLLGEEGRRCQTFLGNGSIDCDSRHILRVTVQESKSLRALDIKGSNPFRLLKWSLVRRIVGSNPTGPTTAMQ